MKKFSYPTRICSRCGALLHEQSNFCQRCGQKTLEYDDDYYDALPIGTTSMSDPEWRPAFRKRQISTTTEKESALWQALLTKEKPERPFPEIEQEVNKEGISYDILPESVKRILSSREYYVVKYKLLEEQDGEYGSDVAQLQLEPSIISSLERLGIKRLFKFQEDSTWSILKGQNIVITAPTGNGKTLAFAVPIFHSIISDQVKQIKEPHPKTTTTRALFVYPTKALARDQLKTLQELAYRNLTIKIFDGDTPLEERNDILDSPPDIIISNFDVLEYHLRNRTRFAALLRDLQFVVVDELHTYLGAFGSHVHFILKRLQRIQRKENGNYRRRIQFVGASATVRNPKQFAELLFFNSKVSEIKCEKGRRGRIHFVMLYPSKTSMTSMIVGCVKVLLSAQMKTLVFANTHKNAEVLNLALKREGLVSEIHRAGLLRNQRTWVEESFKNGSLKSLVSTPTLELGIDIGDLDSVVSMITGITNLTQRMGRAGRKGQESVVVLALRNEDPISAFYKNHPDTYFSDINAAYVEPNNSVVARLEILAAAMDTPIHHPEEFSEFKSLIDDLKKQKLLVERMGRLWATQIATKEVNQMMSIRGIGESASILLENPIEKKEKRVQQIGERGMPMALRELFPHAIYLLAGRKYESLSFEFKGGIYYAKVKRLPDSFMQKTEALRHPDPKIERVLEKKKMQRGIEAAYCELTMTEVVDGYVLKEIFTDKKIGPDIMLPQPLTYTYPTKGFVFRAPQPSKKSLSSSTSNHDDEDVTKHLGDRDDDPISGSFHALEHALIESSDSLTGSGSSEIGGVSMGDSGLIFVYDGSPGGSGLSKLLFDRLDEALVRTLAILKECKCTSSDGCPLCTYSYQCGNNNHPLNKLGAIDSLEQILKGADTTKVKEEEEEQVTSKGKPYL
jgi:DEAD/DEAH box helicase domain-containing protein